MNLLQLDDYNLTSTNETEYDYHLYAERAEPQSFCRSCYNRDIVGFGRHEQIVRDLPRLGKRTSIYINTRRWRCKKCTVTFYDALPDIDDRRLMTERLVKWIGDQAVNRTFSSIAEEVGVSEGTIRQVFADHVKQTYDALDIETPRWLGIDEIYLIKPRCVLTNVEERTAVDILPTRNKDAVIKRLCEWRDRKCIELVTIDMWRPYRDAAQVAVPDATVVVDKFHVVRMANVASETVRKSLRGSMTKHERRGLVNDRWLMLKRSHDLTEHDQMMLSGWLRNYPELAAAYEVKEAAYRIYDATSSQEAQEKYAEWKAGVPQNMRGAFGDFQRAWDNWMPEITAYFDHRVTNAYTESLNNLIRVVNRNGRGYSFEALRAKILLAEGRQKVRRPKFQRVPTNMTAFHGIPSSLSDFPRNLGVSLSTLWQDFCEEQNEA